MAHWLEEVERKQKENEQLRLPSAEEVRKIQQQNLEAMLPFAQLLTDLTERVARIPLEDRKPCNEIRAAFNEKEFKFSYMGSAGLQKEEKKRFRTITFHAQEWRRIGITASQEHGRVTVSIYEKVIPDKHPEKAHREKVRYVLLIEDLSQPLAYDMLDWLACRTEKRTLIAKLAHKKHKP